jgi:hypothetical protein
MQVGGLMNPLLVEKMLHLSVGQLPSGVTKVLAKAADDTPDPDDPNALLVAFDHGQYGWLVLVPHHEDVRDENIPKMLVNIFHVGRAKSASWVYLDPRMDRRHRALIERDLRGVTHQASGKATTTAER